MQASSWICTNCWLKHTKTYVAKPNQLWFAARKRRLSDCWLCHYSFGISTKQWWLDMAGQLDTLKHSKTFENLLMANLVTTRKYFQVVCGAWCSFGVYNVGLGGEHVAIFSRFWPVEQFQVAMENIQEWGPLLDHARDSLARLVH